MYWPCCDMLRITAAGAAEYFQMAALHGKKKKENV